ncbi:hypothetical protein ACC764_39660, partial [Rhizobium ruizarguesonis]
LGVKRSPVDVLRPARIDIRAFSDVYHDRHQTACHQTIDLTGGRDQEREGDKPIGVCRSNEYAAGIINAAVTGNPAL